MRERDEVVKSAEDLIRSILEKNFNQKVDPASVRAAAEKIVSGLPDSGSTAERDKAA